MRIHKSRKHKPVITNININSKIIRTAVHTIISRKTKRRSMPPFLTQPLHIHISINSIIREKIRLNKQSSIFRNYIMTRKNHILRRFILTSISIRISTNTLSRMSLHKITPVIRLPNHLVPRRKINHHSSTVQNMPARRRHRHPQIFANFTRHHQRPFIFIPKQNIRTKRHTLKPRKIHKRCLHIRFKRSKLTPFIKFPIIRQKRFRNQSQQFPVKNHRRTIINSFIPKNRYTHKQKRLNPSRCPHNFLHFLLS